MYARMLSLGAEAGAATGKLREYQWLGQPVTGIVEAMGLREPLPASEGARDQGAIIGLIAFPPACPATLRMYSKVGP